MRRGGGQSREALKTGRVLGSDRRRGTRPIPWHGGGPTSRDEGDIFSLVKENAPGPSKSMAPSDNQPGTSSTTTTTSRNHRMESSSDEASQVSIRSGRSATPGALEAIPGQVGQTPEVFLRRPTSKGYWGRRPSARRIAA